MNKKFMTMLLVIVMVISMVPMTAMAADTDCDHIAGRWTPNDNGTHTSKCECGQSTTTGDCQTFNGTSCYMCGYVFPVEPTCNHEAGGWTPNGNGTHTSKCECGQNTTTGDCQTLNGTSCYMCGYVFHQCTPDTLFSISDTQHQYKCECGEFYGVPANHYDANGDSKCDGCDYTMYERCEHKWTGVTYKDEAAHNIVCRDCEEVLDVESHMYVDGRPCACGAIYSEEEDECDHEWMGVTYKDEATHNIVCRDCEEVLGVESHMYVDGRPCACGAIYSEDEDECDHEWMGVTYKDEGTHYVVCRDCLVTLTVESHKYDNNMPCACGAIYSEDQDDHECTFEAGVTTNNDGTHNVNCECGQFVTVDCLDNDGDGKCDSCGYQKYEKPTEPEKPAEPETPAAPTPDQVAASTAGLDYVPKTGSWFVEWLYALIFG